MATQSQIDANRANAELSTGPKTAEGKSRVAKNAVRHGLTAKNLIVEDNEQEDFDALESSLLADVNPQGGIETVIFNELLRAAWNLHRFRRIEAEQTAGADFADPEVAKLMDRLMRYQAQTQRDYYRALKKLQELQTNRILRAENLSQQDAEAIPVMTDISSFAKQSHSIRVGFIETDRKTTAARSAKHRAWLQGVYSSNTYVQEAAKSPSV